MSLLNEVPYSDFAEAYKDFLMAEKEGPLSADQIDSAHKCLGLMYFNQSEWGPVQNNNAIFILETVAIKALDAEIGV